MIEHVGTPPGGEAHDDAWYVAFGRAANGGDELTERVLRASTTSRAGRTGQADSMITLRRGHPNPKTAV